MNCGKVARKVTEYSVQVDMLSFSTKVKYRLDKSSNLCLKVQSTYI